MRLKRSVGLLAIGVTASLILAACGGDDDDDGGATATTAAATGGQEATATTAAASGEKVELSVLIGDDPYTGVTMEALTKQFTADHPNVTFKIEKRPGGADGDNIVKTKLATGEMNDIFAYNSGSLLQALNPSQSIVDLTGDPMLGNVADAFLPSVTQDGKIYGVPYGTGMGGGLLYNKQ